MTKEQIKRYLESVKADLDEVHDALVEIAETEEEEDDEALLTPQIHIDYLREQEARLLEEYYELQGELHALKTA